MMPCFRPLLAMPLVTVALLPRAGETAPVTELHVAVKGDDAWSGRLPEANRKRTDGPFATLERARDEVRKLKAGGALPEGGLTVWLHGGVYQLATTFALDDRDSGTPEARITYRAYNDEPVRLTGGQALDPASFEPVSDPAVLARLPEEARGKVLQTDLKGQGITNFGEMRPRGFSRPYVNPGLELFFNDAPMRLARWPNDGVVPIGKIIDPGSVPRNGDTSNRGGTFTYDYSRPERWKQAKDIWLSGLFCYGFADDTIQVRAIDTAAKTITLAQPHLYGLATGAPWRAYYALNLLEEIDQPGEWYLDRETGRLYFWPPGPLENARIAVSLLDEPLVALEGVSYVTFQGLSFEVSRGMGVYLERSTGDLIAGCTLRNLGLVAVCFGQGVRPSAQPMEWGRSAEQGKPLPPAEIVSREVGSYQDYLYANTVWNRNAGTKNGVVGCDIYDVGAGGVILSGGDRVTLTPGENYVTNCHVYRFNRLDRAYRSAVMVDGVGNRIANNLIHDAPHNAILLHGNDHLIELNEVHHVCQLADDMGAFYMGRDPSEQGNLLRWNFWHHNGGPKGSSCAIYLDDGACGTTVFGNVFYQQVGQPIWINGGHGHVFRNSIFVENGGAQIGSGMDNSAWRGFVRDPLQVRRLRELLDVTKAPYLPRYPGLGDLFSEDPNTRRGQQVWDNVAYKSGDFGVGRNNVKDNLVTSENPGLVDLAHLDFRLRPDSVVFRKVPGFQPIPFEKIGLYVDEYRKSVPPRVP